jgi:hypothetical protein
MKMESGKQRAETADNLTANYRSSTLIQMNLKLKIESGNVMRNA